MGDVGGEWVGEFGGEERGTEKPVNGRGSEDTRAGAARVGDELLEFRKADEANPPPPSSAANAVGLLLAELREAVEGIVVVVVVVGAVLLKRVGNGESIAPRRRAVSSRYSSHGT